MIPQSVWLALAILGALVCPLLIVVGTTALIKWLVVLSAIKQKLPKGSWFDAALYVLTYLVGVAGSTFAIRFLLTQYF